MKKLLLIKQYIWLIILVASTLILAEQTQTNISFALGIITSNVLRDGLIFTGLVWGVTYYFRKESWKWYDWLNMLAYTTIVARLLYNLFFSL